MRDPTTAAPTMQKLMMLTFAGQTATIAVTGTTQKPGTPPPPPTTLASGSTAGTVSR